MTRDELQKRIDGVIAKCIRNDYAFGSYAHEVTEVVWPVLEAAEKERDNANAAAAGVALHAGAMQARLEMVENERDDLRAKIEAMERQKPVRHEFQGRDGAWYPFIDQRHYENTVADGTWPIRALYALPGAQPQLNEIRTALQRALELGARETWTGARKHRSWEDQREEQQCWNKVWSLLGAQGEGK